MSERLECDVLCIGAGGAGIVAAVTAAEAGASVIVVSKGPYGCGNTRIAAGLVLRPNISPKDSTDALMRDIIVGGEFLNDQELVENYCMRAPLATELMERFGIIFSRKRSGELAPLPTPLGGHSLPRTLTGYSEGVPIGTALRAAVARSNVTVLDETLAVHLLRNGKAVSGALCLQWLTGKMITVTARQTILAAGGLGWIFYPHTSNMRAMTGDGYALALEAGAELMDMEHQQFIPFALTHPDSMVGIVCGEPAIAGPYGRLLDAHGKQVLSRVRTLTRAEVAAAMSLAKERGRATEYGGMLLDLSPNFRGVVGAKMFEFLKQIFPSMTDAVRRAYGEEAARGQVSWDVFPTGHYQIGGVRVGPDCRVRGVDNLFAIGEIQGGLYGANRIGSTSLAELFIFGSMAGKLAAETAGDMQQPRFDSALAEKRRADAEGLPGKSGILRPIELVRKLQKTMWEKVGPIRDESRLAAALDQISAIAAQHGDMRVSNRRDCNPEWVDALELERMLIVADVIARSAMTRKESRGGHVRLDHPKRDDRNWLKNVIVRMDDGTLSVRSDSVTLSRFGLNTKGGPNPARERIQFLILSLLPPKTQARILDSRLNLGRDT
ncbi:MAG: FAD-binding protein [Candidatus Hydrogenedentota bacterium]|nr:MAG: FAD-binding protein [Candidatus Hydrogenedentota bacterium]